MTLHLKTLINHPMEKNFSEREFSPGKNLFYFLKNVRSNTATLHPIKFPISISK